MKWVKINNAYFNTNLITSFYWALGRLYIYFVAEGDAESYTDPNRENYLRLCRQLGVRPVEEDADGKG
jgi:hypothetical protein